MYLHTKNSKEQGANPLLVFIQLVTGKITHDRLWKCWRFRTKFFLRSLLFPISTFCYLKAFTGSPSMQMAFANQGLLPAKIHRPYLRSGLSVNARMKAITQHYKFIESIKKTSVKKIFLPATEYCLANFSGKNDESFEVYCCSGFFDREGEMTLFIKYNDIILASLSFSVIQHHGVPSILVGGLQGPRKETANGVIKEATKASYGLFPKRILVEVLLLLARVIDINNIIAVGNKSHVFRSARYRHSKKDNFHANYSDFWSSLMGKAMCDELYSLPLIIPRKPLEKIASKKRSEYKHRYELLDNIDTQLTSIAE